MSSSERPPPLAQSSRGIDRFLGLLLLGAAGLLVMGWLLPVMTIRTLLVFYDEVSILEGGLRLLDSGDYLLFLLIMAFTVIFPVCKIALAFLAWTSLHGADPRLARALGWIEALGKWSMLDVFVIALHGADPRLARALGWIEALGKWSMLDVFVIALLVVVIKLSLISDVVIHIGLYIFAAAVIFSMLAVKRIAVLARRSVEAKQQGEFTKEA
jgi:paraquat-inducible protein A